MSYLEIYNNDGFDLLSVKNKTSSLLDLPKVVLMEDRDGVIISLTTIEFCYEWFINT